MGISALFACQARAEVCLKEDWTRNLGREILHFVGGSGRNQSGVWCNFKSLTLGLLAQAGKGKECARGAAAPSAPRWVWGGRV